MVLTILDKLIYLFEYKAMLDDVCRSKMLGFMELIHLCGLVVTSPCAELYFFLAWHEYQSFCKHLVVMLDRFMHTSAGPHFLMDFWA